MKKSSTVYHVQAECFNYVDRSQARVLRLWPSALRHSSKPFDFMGIVEAKFAEISK